MPDSLLRQQIVRYGLSVVDDDYSRGYRCECPSGIADGDLCLDECASSPCGNATCVDLVSTYMCECPGTQYWNYADRACQAGGGCSGSFASCKEWLHHYPGLASGVYPVCAPLGHPSFLVYCDMETDGGGWTLVANINPVDSNIVGYGQDFWLGQHEYGNFTHHFAFDYKSPAAYLLTGPAHNAEDGELMVQSVAYPRKETDSAFASAQVRGWRKWPMITDSFAEMFSTGCCRGDSCGNGRHPCRTGWPSGVDVGQTDQWDDIIRRGNCLRTNVRYGFGNGGEAFRLMIYDPGSTDDRMGGFGGATNSGDTLCSSQGRFGQRDNAGVDRILCNQDRQSGCGHGEVRIMQNPVTGARAPCQQSPHEDYCTTSTPYHYNDPSSFIPAWTSRFFVREPTALTPQVIAAMAACEVAGRYWVEHECTDRPPRPPSRCITVPSRYCINYARSHQFSVSDPAHCQALCEEDPTCTGGYWFAGTPTCYHFGVSGSQDEMCDEWGDSGDCTAFSCHE